MSYRSKAPGELITKSAHREKDKPNKNKIRLIVIGKRLGRSSSEYVATDNMRRNHSLTSNFSGSGNSVNYITPLRKRRNNRWDTKTIRIEESHQSVDFHHAQFTMTA